jgi:DnaJ-class molecular chaperone
MTQWIDCIDCGGTGCDPGGLSSQKTDCPECGGYGRVQAPDTFFVEEMELEEQEAA